MSAGLAGPSALRLGEPSVVDGRSTGTPDNSTGLESVGARGLQNSGQVLRMVAHGLRPESNFWLPVSLGRRMAFQSTPPRGGELSTANLLEKKGQNGLQREASTFIFTCRYPLSAESPQLMQPPGVRIARESPRKNLFAGGSRNRIRSN